MSPKVLIPIIATLVGGTITLIGSSFGGFNGAIADLRVEVRAVREQMAKDKSELKEDIREMRDALLPRKGAK